MAGRLSRPLAKAGTTAEASCLQGRDDAVVMGGVPGQHVGAHDEEADATLHRCRRGPAPVVGVLADPAGFMRGW